MQQAFDAGACLRLLDGPSVEAPGSTCASSASPSDDPCCAVAQRPLGQHVDGRYAVGPPAWEAARVTLRDVATTTLIIG